MRPITMHTDDHPDVMDLRDEPLPCEVCGNDSETEDCPMGRFCAECHADLNLSGCRADDCWAYEFNDYES